MKHLSIILALLCSTQILGQNSITVNSPDKQVAITFKTIKGELKYGVRYK